MERNYGNDRDDGVAPAAPSAALWAAEQHEQAEALCLLLLFPNFVSGEVQKEREREYEINYLTAAISKQYSFWQII